MIFVSPGRIKSSCPVVWEIVNETEHFKSSLSPSLYKFSIYISLLSFFPNRSQYWWLCLCCALLQIEAVIETNSFLSSPETQDTQRCLFLSELLSSVLLCMSFNFLFLSFLFVCFVFPVAIHWAVGSSKQDLQDNFPSIFLTMKPFLSLQHLSLSSEDQHLSVIAFLYACWTNSSVMQRVFHWTPDGSHLYHPNSG